LQSGTVGSTDSGDILQTLKDLNIRSLYNEWSQKIGFLTPAQ
jgi:hypothetical protein